jgi:hypothetical protein
MRCGDKTTLVIEGSSVDIEWKLAHEVSLTAEKARAQYNFYAKLIQKMYARPPRQPWVRKTRRKTKRF